MRPFTRSGFGRAFCLTIAVTGALSANLPNFAHAEVIIAGTSEDAHIQTSDATLEQLLSALREKLDLAYTSSAPLDHKVQDGTFVGPLTKILMPLLKDYNHFMKVQNGHISLVLREQQRPKFKGGVIGTAAVTPASTAPQSAAPATSDTNASAKNEVAAESKNENVVTPDGATPIAANTSPATSPPPSPFAVTTFLETQTAPFMNQASTANRAAPPQGAVSDPSQPAQLSPQESSQFAAQQAAVAQTMQRANIALQSMARALGRLPQ